jgi:hypothetical protein
VHVCETRVAEERERERERERDREREREREKERESVCVYEIERECIFYESSLSSIPIKKEA